MNNQQLLPRTKVTLKLMACVLFSIAAIFVSCKKTADKPTPTPSLPPGFSFTANPDRVNVITFSDTSKNAVSYYWNFGESSANGKDTSTKKTCTYTYNPNSGTSFKVKLVITDQNNKKDSITKTITITYPVQSVAEFDTLRRDGVSTGTYAFINTTKPYAYDTHSITWDFGDNSAKVTRAIGTSYDVVEGYPYTYTQSGMFPVTLTITDVYGRVSTITKTVHPKMIKGIFIKKVNLLQIPDKKADGEDYDRSDAPDPYFTYSINNQPASGGSAVVLNSFSASWTAAISSLLNSKLEFKFYDHDDAMGADVIGSIIMNLNKDKLHSSRGDDAAGYTMDYSETLPGGQLKISIEFNFETE